MDETQEKAIEDEILKHDISITKLNEGKHWRLKTKDLTAADSVTVDYWPNSGKAQAFARVFVPKSITSLCQAMTSGRIQMPEDAGEATCNACGNPIWWVKSVNGPDPTKNGKNTPVDKNGATHWGTCAGRKQNRPTRKALKASEDFLEAAKESFNDEIPF